MRILVTCYFTGCSSQTIQIIVVVVIYKNAFFFTKYFGLKELVLKLLSYLFFETMPDTDLRHVTVMVKRSQVLQLI